MPAKSEMSTDISSGLATIWQNIGDGFDKFCRETLASINAQSAAEVEDLHANLSGNAQKKSIELRLKKITDETKKVIFSLSYPLSHIPSLALCVALPPARRLLRVAVKEWEQVTIF